MKKFIGITMSMLLIGGLLASCGQATSGDVKIQFMHSMVEQERLTVIDEIIADFESKNPGIKIESVPVEEDAYNTKITTLGSSSQLPAVIEVGHDYAKVMDKDKFIDNDAIKSVITSVGEESYYEGALNLLKSEDGTYYTGVPLSGWVQGVWYSKSKFAEKNLPEPKTWNDILTAAKTFTDSSTKKYGIGLATAEGIFTEQSFSQFALSNNANVFSENGDVTVNSSEMKEALSFYKELASYTMPGSNDVTEVKDAFMNGTVPMALYSTYIMPSIYKEGKSDDLGYAIPTQKDSAVFGTVTSLVITDGLKEEEKAASEKFVAYMNGEEANTKWVLMAPGGMQPVIKQVAEGTGYQSNEIIQAFGDVSKQVAQSFNNLQVFGQVGKKNFSIMGDVTSSVIIGRMVNQATVGGKDVETVLAQAQAEIEKLVSA